MVSDRSLMLARSHGVVQAGHVLGLSLEGQRILAPFDGRIDHVRHDPVTGTFAITLVPRADPRRSTRAPFAVGLTPS